MVHKTSRIVCSVIWFVAFVSLGKLTHVIIHLPASKVGGWKGRETLK